MNWLPHISTALVEIISAIISYLAAIRQGKTEIKKLTETNKADIERLMHQHKIDIDNLREKHRLEMEIKTLDLEHKIQLMQTESNVRTSENEQSLDQKLKSEFVATFLTQAFENPDQAAGNIENLKKLSDMFST